MEREVYANAYLLRWIDGRSAGTSNSRMLRPHRSSNLRDTDDEEMERQSQPTPTASYDEESQIHDRDSDRDEEREDSESSPLSSPISDASAHIPLPVNDQASPDYSPDQDSPVQDSQRPSTSRVPDANYTRTYRPRIINNRDSQSSSFSSLNGRNQRRRATKLLSSSPSGYDDRSITILESSASLNLPSIHFTPSGGSDDRIIAMPESSTSLNLPSVHFTSSSEGNELANTQ